MSNSFLTNIQTQRGGALLEELGNRYQDLKTWFDLHRPEKVVETAFGEMVQQVEEETGAYVIWGDPLE